MFSRFARSWYIPVLHPDGKSYPQIVPVLQKTAHSVNVLGLMEMYRPSDVRHQSGISDGAISPTPGQILPSPPTVGPTQASVCPVRSVRVRRRYYICPSSIPMPVYHAWAVRRTWLAYVNNQHPLLEFIFPVFAYLVPHSFHSWLHVSSSHVSVTLSDPDDVEFSVPWFQDFPTGAVSNTHSPHPRVEGLDGEMHGIGEAWVMLSFDHGCQFLDPELFVKDCVSSFGPAPKYIFVDIIICAEKGELEGGVLISVNAETWRDNVT
ncbi:hypothetical protein B0H14DRAFT_2607171 [Mycena olivaceomarginata]|nr:hypothetical protein B0H14DRAFT_2607171 [Mycena olivaceomarginata]